MKENDTRDNTSMLFSVNSLPVAVLIEATIESILLGLPVPEIYVQQVVDTEGKSRFAVVDGQQRMTSLYGVARGLKELKGGYNGLGLMTTLAQRRFDGSGLKDRLNEQSLMG
jgi:hypothetical protein